VWDLTNLTTQELADGLQFLQDNTWLDRQTRALFVSLVVYNANFNLYAVLNFQLELSLAGVITPKYYLQTVKMDLFRSWDNTFEDKLTLIVEGIMYLGMFYYLFNEFIELRSVYSATGSARGYFGDFWNVIDWTLILLSFFALIMRIQFFLRPVVQNFDPFTPEYVELQREARMYNDSFAYDAVAASFGIFKIFRFFELQRNLLILRESITRGLSDLSIFTFMMVFIIAGFSFSGMNIFGQENEEYVNFQTTFITLFLTVLGEFDFDALISVNMVFGYLFFLLYQIFVFLVMLNIFLAILNDAYIAIKFKFDAEELEEPPPPLTIKQRWEKFRAWLRQRHLDQRIEALRKQQRQRELVEKRAERKVNEARTRTLKAMGVDPEQQARGQGGGGGGNDSALLRTEEL